MESEPYDVVVIGGGAAGLSAALVIGRARRRVVVVDGGEPRNAPAAHMQGFLSRDGMPPADLLAVGRDEVAAYGVEFVSGQVVSVEPGFSIRLAGGEQLGAGRTDESQGDEGLPGSPGPNGDVCRADDDRGEEKPQRRPENRDHGGILPLATRGGAVR